MNFPEIPKTNIDRCDAINLLFTSLATEELALAKVIHEEARKLEKGICLSDNLCDLFNINDSVNNLLKTIIQKELVVLLTLEEVAKLDRRSRCSCCDHHKPKEL
jgi:hypothetical protein